MNSSLIAGIKLFTICKMTHVNLDDIVRFHEALSDPLRVRLMRLLMERELCVCELVESTRQPQYKVSRHLGILKKAGLLHDWRDGKWIHYEISPSISPLLKEVLQVLRKVWDQLVEVEEDLRRLREHDRPAGCGSKERKS